MATRRKSSTQSKSGGMISGIVIGLILGLAAAVAVALYISKAPIPFTDRGHQSSQPLDIRNAPDPNQALYRSSPPLDQSDPIAEQLKKLELNTPAQQPASPTAPSSPDSLDSLIAQLPNPNKASNAAASPTPASKPAASKLAAAPTTYYLQAGAFRSTADAEAMRARILLLGMDVAIQSAPYEGGTINRVRVGPFSGLDQMNQARSVLGREKIETSVARP